MKTSFFYLASFAVVVLITNFLSSQAKGQESRNPASVRGELRQANEEKEARLPMAGLDPVFRQWYETKDLLKKRYGFNFAIAYTPLYQIASSSLSGQDQASGAIFETLGTLDLFDSKTNHPGSLGFKLEGRDRLWNKIAPQSLAAEIGAGVPTALAFGEFDLSLAELWWEQHIIKNRFSFRVGKMLPFGNFDFFPYKNPKTGFTNAAFALNPTIAWPQFGLGISTEIRPREDIYILLGLNDANGSPTRSGFNTFFDESEYFKIAEVGWDPGYLVDGKKKPLAPDYHLTVWHSDERMKAGRPEGWGMSFTANQPFGNVIAFGRYGYSEGGAALLKHLVSGGIAINNAFGWQQDTIGIALGIGEPSAQGLRTQFTAELYSKMQLTRRLALTPNLQFISKPSANPDRNSLVIAGIRARLNF